MLLSLLSFAAAVAPVPVAAGPPTPPPEFATPQSPTKPPPFAVTYVDQGKYDPRLNGILAPAGFKTELVADDAVVTNPTGMTFAPDGTLFVCEWTVDPVTQGRWFEFKETFRYRDGTVRQVATMKKFVVDPIKVLRFNPAKGVYDRAETIVAEEIPSSLLYHDGWLYTAGRGTVRRYTQSRPGGPWDVRDTIAQGFCGFHHHQVSGLTVGNDGKLYITSGDDDNVVEGSDGSRATVLRTGAVFRCNPDGSQFEAYSLGYRNPYRDLAYDDKFNWFHADNDNEDGSKFTGCRLVHVLEGVDYGWRLKIGARCCQPDFARGAVGGELPGKLPPMLKTGRGSPAGLLIYHDTRLPERYRGLLYYPDVFRKLVRAYTVAPKGASFAVTHEFEFLKSDDPLFRPCQMVTGPDGAVYVCDWRTDSGGAGRLSGDGKHGRIYRLTWVGTPGSPALPPRGLDSWAKLVKLPDAQLVEALNAPDFTDRVEARKELVRRGPKARDLVLRRLVSGGFEPAGRLVALGVLDGLWSADVEDLFRLLLNDTSADVRRLAATALGAHGKPGDRRTHEALVRLLTDDTPAVRRAVALAVARLGADGAADALVAAWKFDDGHDVFLTDGLLRAVERLGKPGIDALLAVANSGQKADLDKVAAGFAALRTRPAAAALPDLLASPHLTADRRADLLRSYTNYEFDPPLSLDPVADYLTAHPDEPAAVKIAGLTVLAAGGFSSPKAVATVLGVLDGPDVEVRFAAYQVIEQSRVTAAIGKLVEILGDPKRQPGERAAVLRALRSTGGAAAIKPLAALLGRPEPAALKVDALRALAASDPAQAQQLAEKLLDQPDPALLAEAVAVLGTTPAGAKLVGERFAARKLPRDLFARVTEILQKFSTDPVIAKVYGDVMKGGLLLSLDPARTEQIRKLVAAKGDPVRGKAVYLNTAVLACATCHRMEGVGGAVGPDLTRLWDTQTLDKILESIVEPSKEIKEGYQAFKAVTAAGQVYTGLKVTDTAKDVVIRDAGGRDVRVAKADLDELTPLKTSLMPDNVVSQLSFDQFVDLLAFLKSRVAQESLRGSVLEFAVAAGPKSAAGGAAGPEAAPELPGTLDGKAAWEVRPVGPDGALDLASAVAADRPSAYAATWVFSPKKQAATVTLRAGGAFKLWVNGKDALAGPLPLPRPAAGPPTAGVTVPVDLPAGWTPVVVKITPTAADRKVALHVSGDGVRTATRPDPK